MMVNSGQTCSAGSRLLVPKKRMAEAIEAARKAANAVTVGDPKGNFAMGPVVSKNQFNEIQRYIHIGIEEGAELIAGGPDRPDGIDRTRVVSGKSVSVRVNLGGRRNIKKKNEQP